MNAIKSVHGGASTGNFDLFRLTKSKQAVDLSPNTLRKYHSLGLPFYRQGRVVFVSKAELHLFICSKFTNSSNNFKDSN